MAWQRGEMCSSCAGRKGTEANVSRETMETLDECIRTGEPFYCHESVAVADPDGEVKDSQGKRYRRLPFERWRLCRAWMAACPDGGLPALTSATGQKPMSSRRL